MEQTQKNVWKFTTFSKQLKVLHGPKELRRDLLWTETD